MNLAKRIIDLGTAERTNPLYNKYIRFSNSISLIVCFFIVQNTVLAIYYHQPILILIYIIHFAMIAMIPVFNYIGKRVLASSWFSGVAILFVTFYSIVFTLDSYNFVFLALTIFVQFFIFSTAEKKHIFIFTIIIILCLTGIILWHELDLQPSLSIPKGLLDAQRMNSLIGIPLLSIAIGFYAFSTIHKAEQEAAREKEKTELLLLNILPEEVAEELKAKGSAAAKQFDKVTVMFTDFKGFTQISEKLTPSELVAEIHTCFKAFDNIITKYNIEKIKTIGDAYMCAGGVPVANKTNPDDVIKAAIEIQQFMQQHLKQRKNENKEPFEIRIGIHTGPVVAGIVGVKKFAYDIWGDTVNIASRMESSSEAGKINISGSTHELVKDKFNCTHRGKIQAKKKGEVDMYFVEGRI